MKLCQIFIVLLSIVLLSGCALQPDASCFFISCQVIDANNSRLNIWWSPKLQDGGGQYSTVNLND